MRRPGASLRKYEAIGPTDDALDTDGVNALTFAQPHIAPRGRPVQPPNGSPALRGPHRTMFA